MNLKSKVTALAAGAVGATALTSVAAADFKTAQAAAGPAPVSFSIRVPVANDVTHRLDDGHTVRTWNYTDGTVWVHAKWVDVRKCTVAPVVGSSRPVLAAHENANYVDWLLISLWAPSGTSRASGMVDVTITCPASAVIAAAQQAPAEVTPAKPPRR